ncbi:type II secretion system F family protein [Streptomyces cavernicola]|uniref:Type II secretion system protein GspF domain-containing protein n=1 Tax=Streptomyces cavernicola TaxID=3043613 RepID=A0ABT6SJG9_9ACTN|nr:hypothetical protein [Streptomyces sp. B-S-A6]MDI3408351.1 hypothetical protein [Streptomyces sp. B-S-A6]
MNTTQWSLLAALFGALIVTGLLLAITGLRGVEDDPARPASRAQERWQRMRATMPEAWATRYRLLCIVAAVAAILTWAYTLRPIQGLMVAVAVLGFPWVWNPAGTAQRQVQRLEAIAEWLQQLAGMHQSSATLETAIAASATRCPQIIRPQVRTLAARLRMGVDPTFAYRQFADQFADGAVDNVALLFLAHTKDHGRGLTRALQTMSQLTASEATALSAIDAERNRARQSTRWVSVICIGFVLYLVTGTSWGDVYRTATGQLVLVALSAGFIAALWWLRRMAVTPPDPRLLDPLPAKAAQAQLRNAAVPAPAKGAFS